MIAGSLGSFSNTDLVEFVIASEIFELYGQSGVRLKKIALAAAKRWAGADQTASGLLVTYLRKNVQSYKYFVVSSCTPAHSPFAEKLVLVECTRVSHSHVFHFPAS